MNGLRQVSQETRQYNKDGARAEFNAKMEALVAKISALTGDDQANFQEYFSTLYNKYLAIYELTSEQKTVTLSEAEQKLVDEYIDILEKYFAVYGSMYYLLQSGYEVPDELYPVLYAFYARASELRSALKATLSEDALLTMYTTEYDIGSLKYTLEGAYYRMDSVTTSVLTSMSAVVSNGDGTVRYATYWELYNSNGIKEFLSDNVYVLYYSYFDEGKAVEHADFLAIMAEMREFDTLKMSIVTLFNIDDTFYRAMNRYYETVLEADGVTAVGKIVAAARAYTTYSVSNTEENLSAFVNAVEELKLAYEAVSNADKAYLNDLYTYYVGLAESLQSNGGEAA